MPITNRLEGMIRWVLKNNVEYQGKILEITRVAREDPGTWQVFFKAEGQDEIQTEIIFITDAIEYLLEVVS